MRTRARVGVALAVLGAAALVALVGTCSDETAEAPQAAERAPPPPATPRTRVAPRRSAERRDAAEDARPAAELPPESARPPAASLIQGIKIGPLAAVLVRVTQDGRPVEGADVWLRGLASGETSPDVPATQWSDATYFGVPRHLGLAEWFDPAPKSDAVRGRLGECARTDSDGVAEVFARPDLECAVVVASADGRWVVREAPTVTPLAHAAVDVAVSLAARPPALIEGRCLSEDGAAVVGAMVQAFDAEAERAASALVRTDATGAFALLVDGARAPLRVRVAAPRHLPMCDTEAALPPVLDDTVVAGVVPGGAPLDVRLRRAPSVVLELTSEVPFGHLQVEELAFEPVGECWGRLGGPVYQRDVGRAADPRRAFVALARADAQRPLMLWTWGGPAELTGVDPRGRARVSAHFRRGRKVTATGKGWHAGDRLRVVCFIGPPGEEFPGVWVEGPVTEGTSWSRDDTPPCDVEFRLVRDGREIGARPRVPAGQEEATVRIDL